MNARRLPGSRLAWALAASLLLHLAVVADAVQWPWPPAMSPAVSLPPLELRLPPVVESAMPPPPSRPSPPAVAPPPPPVPASPHALVAQSPPRPAQAPELPDPAPSTAVPPAPPFAPASIDAASERLPQSGRLVYQFYWGKLRWLAGEAVQQWEIRNGIYTLSSSLATTGLFGWLRPFRLLETAKGLVVGGRLRPLQFTTHVNDELRLVSVFNWEKPYFRWYDGLGATTQDLPPNSFDKISFLFQLYVDGKTDGLAPVQITMGRRLDAYAIESLGAEDVDIDGRSYPATHLRTSASAADTGRLDIWLSAGDNLPLKMTYVSGAGDYFEQLITAESLPEGRPPR